MKYKFCVAGYYNVLSRVYDWKNTSLYFQYRHTIISLQIFLSSALVDAEQYIRRGQLSIRKEKNHVGF